MGCVGTGDAYIIFIDTYLISVHSGMFPLLKPGISFVMNYFIMPAKAVIKCVAFYDNAVMEGGRHKSCPGLFFHLANAETDK